MSEYIEREATIKRIQEVYCVGCKGRCCPHEFYDSIEQAITDSEYGVPCDHLIEVEPVVHGRWEYIPQTLNTLSRLRCSFCGWWSLDPSIDGTYNYCPNCGAKMDGGADHEVD